MKNFTSALLALFIIASSNCFATDIEVANFKKDEANSSNFMQSDNELTTTETTTTNKLVRILSYNLPKNDDPLEKIDISIQILDNGDITSAPRLFKDKKIAIVNAANSMLLNGNGVCGSIFNATKNNGRDLANTLRKINSDEHGIKCKPGEAVTTDAFGIENVKKIIHTVAPNLSGANWPGNKFNKWTVETRDILKNCYTNALKEADKNECDTIIFPSLGTGIYGCPIDKTPACIKEAINEYYQDNENSNIKNIIFTLRDRAVKEYLRFF